MSHTLRRPLFRATRFAPSIATRRYFSHYRPLHALPTASSSSAPRSSMPPERSVRLQAMQNQVMPSDIGILEKTFITPTGNKVPSIVLDLPSYLRLQYQRLKLHGRDYLSLVIFKFSSPKTTSFFRRRFVIKRAQTAPAAVALHRQMYTAFAEGEVTSLRKICADGLFETFASRVANRERGEKVEWELVKYNKRTKVVSHRAGRMPLEGTGIRQAVVRVCSRQRLTRWRRGRDGKMEMVAGSGKEKDVVEYLVVQRIMRDWEEGEWKVWGTTGETTLEDVDKWKQQELS